MNEQTRDEVIGLMERRIAELEVVVADVMPIVERTCRRAKDGKWVHPGDRVWLASRNGPRWFTLHEDFSVPVCRLVGGVWADFTVDDCYSTREAAEAAREGQG